MAMEHEMKFLVDGEELVGVLRLPEGYGDGPFATLVFMGPLTCVKEQVPGNYAQAMAKRGFATLAFDHRHFGESGGEPRQYEHPGRKVDDARGALDALAERPEVDASRLGVVGICAGAGYMAVVAAEDPRVRAFGAVAGFFHHDETQKQWMGEGYGEAIERARLARQAWEAGEEAEMIPAVGLEGDVAMPMKEAWEYYGTERGQVPGYRNAFAVMSREHTLPWNARGVAASIRVPTLVIHSENALAPSLARAFIAELGGPVEEEWVSSKGQIDFYDDPALIATCADRLAEHFCEVMGPQRKPDVPD